MSETKPSVTIYTDGGCKPNPGPGGWGAVLLFSHSEQELKGHALDTTNNQMELTAAIKALSALKSQHRVELNTDSTYLKNGITQWISAWKKKGWRTSTGSPVKNQDLWQKLEELITQHDIQWKWVRGHAGDEYNERVHELATEARAELTGEITTSSSVAEQRTNIAIYTNCIFDKDQRQQAWGAVIVRGGEAQPMSGIIGGKSDNHARLLGAIMLLESLDQSEPMDIYTDSEYIQKGISQWVSGWIKKGWRTKSGSPVKYKDLWQRLHQLDSKRAIYWHYAPAKHELITHAKTIAKEQLLS